MEMYKKILGRGHPSLHPLTPAAPTLAPSAFHLRLWRSKLALDLPRKYNSWIRLCYV